MTNWVIYEGDGETISSKMASPEVVIGDTIERVTNNQEGYKKVRVVQGEDGNKDTIILADWGIGKFEEPDDEPYGGKRRRKRSRKTRKSKKSRKGRKHRKTRRTRRH